MALIRCIDCRAKVSDKAIACPKCGAPVEISKKEQKSHISTRTGFLIIILVVASIITAYISSDQEDGSRPVSSAPTTQSKQKTPTSFVPAQTKPIASLPTYDVVDSDIYDAPIKTQITFQAVVSGTITEQGLKQLLEKLYDEANATRGLTYHGGKPTHVFIYLYTSRDHFKSGMGQWIAMLSKIGDDSRIDTKIRTELIALLHAKPEVKHGLSESTRKEIFQDSIKAEDQANAEAERRYPLEPERAMKAGDELKLTRETLLMPELEPADALEALQKIQRLPIGATIRVKEVTMNRITPWYEVTAISTTGNVIGSGWINSIALQGQSETDMKDQMHKQMELMDELLVKYKAEVAKRYNITEEQLKNIDIEGIAKNWPTPPMQ